jgi:hypothetical protein
VYKLVVILTAKRRATVTPVLRSSRPRKDERGHRRHSGRSMSFMAKDDRSSTGVKNSLLI